MKTEPEVLGSPAPHEEVDYSDRTPPQEVDHSDWSPPPPPEPRRSYFSKVIYTIVALFIFILFVAIVILWDKHRQSKGF